jgi:hypothetical protein
MGGISIGIKGSRDVSVVIMSGIDVVIDLAIESVEF